MHKSLVGNTQVTAEMDNWSVEHHIVCVEFFVKTESVIQTKYNFRRMFNVRRAPFCNVIKMA
jgi:hypothetical protein